MASEGGSSQYKAWGMPHSAEDIVLCVDVDEQINSEMKVMSSQGQSLTRLEAIKQALLLFAHAKLVAMSPPQHRIAFATIGSSASWLGGRHYSSDYNDIRAAVNRLGSQGAFSSCDLSSLFRLVAADAASAAQQGRCFRVILVYCRSEVVPTFDEQQRRRCDFVVDALYLHDKPAAHNCPQQVYDVLVELVDPLRGYIYETSRSLARLYFRHACFLLAHPQQRCPQDEFDSSFKDLAPPAPVPTPAPASASAPAPAVVDTTTSLADRPVMTTHQTSKLIH